MWFRRSKADQSCVGELPQAGKSPIEEPRKSTVAEANGCTVEDFVECLPQGCAGIIVGSTGGRHAATIGYGYHDAPFMVSRSSEFSPVLKETCTFSKLLDRFDEAFVHVRTELERDSERWLGRVSVHDPRQLGRALTDCGVPWSSFDTTFVSFLTSSNEGPGSLLESVRKDLHAAASLKRDEALTLVPALAGGAKVHQRDMLGLDYRAGALDMRELLVMSDRRLLLLTSHAYVVGKEEAKLESGSVLEDLGFPQKISCQGNEVVIATTQMANKEVSVSIQGKRLVTGYKSEPRELTLKDPISAAVLVALVDLGCGNVFELAAL